MPIFSKEDCDSLAHKFKFSAVIPVLQDKGSYMLLSEECADQQYDDWKKKHDPDGLHTSFHTLPANKSRFEQDILICDNLLTVARAMDTATFVAKDVGIFLVRKDPREDTGGVNIKPLAFKAG